MSKSTKGWVKALLAMMIGDSVFVILHNLYPTFTITYFILVGLWGGFCALVFVK